MLGLAGGSTKKGGKRERAVSIRHNIINTPDYSLTSGPRTYMYIIKCKHECIVINWPVYMHVTTNNTICIIGRICKCSLDKGYLKGRAA